MPITFEWYDKKRNIIINTIEGYWTWHEGMEVVDGIIALSKQAERVDTIVDMRESNTIVPSGALHYMPIIVKKVSQRLPNWGISVIVSNHWLVAALLKISAAFSDEIKRRYRITDTIENALAIIATDREAHAS